MSATDDIKHAKELVAKAEASLGHPLTSNIIDLICDNTDWSYERALAAGNAIKNERGLKQTKHPNRLQFNTGRKYTSLGQRIVATLHEGGIVTFLDHDRHIDGEFKLCGDFTKEAVMQAYDHNIAKSTQRSWQDAMLMGGCNTVWSDE